MVKVTKLWRTFYDRFFNYYYYQGQDGNFYNAETGQPGFEISEGYEPETLNIDIDLDQSDDNNITSNTSVYIMYLNQEYGVVYFDRMGYIIKQISSRKDDDDDISNNSVNDGTNDSMNERELDGSGTSPVYNYTPIGIPVSLTPVDGKLQLVMNRNEIVEHRLDVMIQKHTEWTIGEGYELVDVDSICHIYMVTGSNNVYFDYREGIVNLTTDEFVYDHLPEGEIHDIRLDFNDDPTPRVLTVYSDFAELTYSNDDNDSGQLQQTYEPQNSHTEYKLPRPNEVETIIWFDQSPFDHELSSPKLQPDRTYIVAQYKFVNCMTHPIQLVN